MIERYRKEPIVSILTGYQRYVARPSGHQVLVQSRRKAYSQHFPLYKVGGSSGVKTRMGQYIGNHQIINTYRNVGTVSPKVDKKLQLLLRNRFSQKNQGVLNDITSRYMKPGTYKKLENVIQQRPAAEEQVGIVGGKGTPKTIRPGQAQDIDIREPFGKFQVTTSRLDQLGHHSITGKKGLGKHLQDRIQGYRNDPNLKEEDKDMKITLAGYDYFKTRMAQWNIALRSIQGPSTMFDSATTVRSRLKSVIAGGGLGIVQASVGGGQEMFKLSTGFLNQGGAQITSTALGNADDFTQGTGVSYTFVIDDFKHAVLQKFKMKLTRNGYMWDESALDRSKARVVYGYMATDDMMKVTGKAGYDNDAAALRAFAQTSLRGNNNAKDVEIMKSVSLGSSALRTNAGTLQADIDLVHANKSLARFIKKRFIPEAKKQLAKDAKSYTKGLIGHPEDITNGLLHGNRADRIWAAPYLSVADYSIEAFGSGDMFSNIRD